MYKNKEKRSEYNKQYHIKNREKILERKKITDSKKYYSRTEKEKEQHRKRSMRYYWKHREKILKETNERLLKARMNVLRHYGNRCNCCGETIPEFLCMDHINGGGNKHRKKIGKSGRHFYLWLIKQNYPKEYQILCYNCNMAKGLYGICPHKRNKIK